MVQLAAVSVLRTVLPVSQPLTARAVSALDLELFVSLPVLLIAAAVKILHSVRVVSANTLESFVTPVPLITSKAVWYHSNARSAPTNVWSALRWLSVLSASMDIETMRLWLIAETVHKDSSLFPRWCVLSVLKIVKFALRPLHVQDVRLDSKARLVPKALDGSLIQNPLNSIKLSNSNIFLLILYY